MNRDEIKNRLHDALHRGHKKASDEELEATEIMLVAVTEVVAEVAILIADLELRVAALEAN
jgi:hypothetical protein